MYSKHLQVTALDNQIFVFYRCFICEEDGVFTAENPELNILSTGFSAFETAKDLGEGIAEFIEFANTEEIADEILLKRPKMSLSTRIKRHLACYFVPTKNWYCTMEIVMDKK